MGGVTTERRNLYIKLVCRGGRESDTAHLHGISHQFASTGKLVSAKERRRSESRKLSGAIARDVRVTRTISRDRLPADWGRGGLSEPDDSGSESCSDAVQVRPELRLWNSARLSYKVPTPLSRPSMPGSNIFLH
jgi:hypothetical protein